MIYFRSDYSLGAHPKIMQALLDTNMEHTDGYCWDRFSEDCTAMIRQWVGKPDAHVYYFVGGTPCNTTTVSAGLKPYEGVITAATGHINARRASFHAEQPPWGAYRFFRVFLSRALQGCNRSGAART